MSSIKICPIKLNIVDSLMVKTNAPLIIIRTQAKPRKRDKIANCNINYDNLKHTAHISNYEMGIYK